MVFSNGTPAPMTVRELLDAITLAAAELYPDDPESRLSAPVVFHGEWAGELLRLNVFATQLESTGARYVGVEPDDGAGPIEEVDI